MPHSVKLLAIPRYVLRSTRESVVTRGLAWRLPGGIVHSLLTILILDSYDSVLYPPVTLLATEPKPRIPKQDRQLRALSPSALCTISPTHRKLVKARR